MPPFFVELGLCMDTTIALRQTRGSKVGLAIADDEMSDTVWVSDAMMDPRQMRPLMNDIGENDLDHAVELIKRNDAGEPLGPECFPQAIWPADHSKRSWDEMPDLFYGFGYWVVSSSCADVLRRFDLGKGALYPVKVYKKDRKTPVKGSYFCLNFGNVKHVFLRGQSPLSREGGREGLFYLPIGVLNDFDIAVSGPAHVGPDIWIDPTLSRAFFVSGRLGEALKAAKLANWFKLKKCRIVGDDGVPGGFV